MKCPHCGHKGKFYKQGPENYVDWQVWAQKMSKTFDQFPCSNCGRLTVWRRKRGGES